MHGIMLKTSKVAKKSSILGIGNIKTIYRPRQKIVFKIYIMSLWVIWATFCWMQMWTGRWADSTI